MTRAFSLCLAVAAFLIAGLGVSRSFAAEVEYSKIDRATVRREALAGRAKFTSPDLVALLAGFHWNRGVLRFALGEGDAAGDRNRANLLARQAIQSDASITRRSPFVAAAVGREAAREAVRKHARKRRSTAPDGVGGFTVGMTEGRARAACEKEGHEFKTDGDARICGGPVDGVPFDAKFRLSFCGGQLCRVDLLAQPSQSVSKVWLHLYDKLYKALNREWGAADDDERVIPPACVQLILPCLRRGQAAVRHRWVWDGHRAELAMGRVDGEPVIRISHRRDPAKVATVDAHEGRTPALQRLPPRKCANDG